MEKVILLVSLFCLAAPAAQAAVQGRDVSYQADGTTLRGYLAYDAEADHDSWQQTAVFLRMVFGEKWFFA